ncbi:MAG: protein phosphatase 2C domain-containing protein [Candidatus Electrothrix sp. YB6]
MKEHTSLRAACRNILNGQALTEEELDQFLETTAVVEALNSFSDELLQHWYMWKKYRTAPKDNVISAAKRSIEEELLADFQEAEDRAASSQDTSNKEKAPEELSVEAAETDDAEEKNDPPLDDSALVDDDQVAQESEETDMPPQEDLSINEETVEEPAESAETEHAEKVEQKEEVEGTDCAEPPEAVSGDIDATEEGTDTALPVPEDATQHTLSPPEATEPPPIPENNQEQEEQGTHSADPGIHLPPQSTTMQPDIDPSIVQFKLPNAMVNSPYSEELSIAGGEVLKITKIEGLEATGICYDPETQRVEGMPSTPGEFSVKVTCILSSGGSGVSHFDFVVNHDPKSLWKDIPSDQGVMFWKPDEAAEERAGHGIWRLVAASKRGRSHAHEGKCRDDDFMLLSEHPDQWHILAVSDGAGSSQYSREGSRLAVRTSTAVLAEKLTEQKDALADALSAWNEEQSDRTEGQLRQVLYSVFSQAIYQAINTIHQKAKKEQCRFRDFYATLLLAAHKEIQGRHFLVGYWIGDGGIALYQEGQEGENGDVRLLGRPDSGEYAGQTRFLDPEANDGEDIMRRISFTCVDSMTALFLLTDGITDPIFETDHNLQQPERWDRFWAEEIRPKLSGTPGETAKNLLDWLSFWSPGNHDDRTIALLGLRNKHINPACRVD